MTLRPSRSLRSLLGLRARGDRNGGFSPVPFLLFTFLCSLVGCGQDGGTRPPPPENQWSALGPGFSHPARALATYRDELVAGGRFLQAGDSVVNGIARWDGSSWHRLGAGFGPAGSVELVHSLLVHEEGLIAGGDFSQAGGTAAGNVARWDGAAWSPLGAGIDGPVLALAAYGGQFVAGGAFENAGESAALAISFWDGGQWAPLGAGMRRSGRSATVEALVLFRGNLIAAGDFDQAGDDPASNIARWDGAGWSPLAGGADGKVHALAVWNDRLIAGGEFTHVGGVAANRIAQWDGTAWQSLGSGMTVALEGFPAPGVVCLASFETNLIAGGYFRKAGGGWANCIARWNGASWFALGGTDLPVLGLAVHDGGLILAGGFDWAGGVTAHRIARWGL